MGVLFRDTPKSFCEAFLVWKGRHVSFPRTLMPVHRYIHRGDLTPLAYSCLRFDKPFPTVYCPNPLDGIGARRFGIAVLSSMSVGRRLVSDPILSFGFWPVGSFSIAQQHLRCIFCSYELQGSKDELCAGSLPPALESCQDADPQYHQKINSGLGPYPVGNGLSKRR